MAKSYAQDSRIVMSLDAGGTSFRFSALRGNQPVVEPFSTPSYGDDLEACLKNLVLSFTKLRGQLPQRPAAISFAFPGPADYRRGIIGDLGNLPGFRGGVALGLFLQEKFGIPVFLNNDGDLFTYGEAIAGFLPYVNTCLEQAGSTRRYRNLFGITLGTGFGGGFVHDGQLVRGDTISAAEIWIFRNKLEPTTNAEEGVSIRALKRAYAAQAKVAPEIVPEPKVLADIAMGAAPGHPLAAQEAFRRLGEVAGDALAHALALVDGLAVIGGGISHAWPLFLPAMVAELNGHFVSPKGQKFRRLTQEVFNLQDSVELSTFARGSEQRVRVPGSDRSVAFDPQPRLGLGVSRLGTSEAVAIGAYAFALQQLDQGVSG